MNNNSNNKNRNHNTNNNPNNNKKNNSVNNVNRVNNINNTDNITKRTIKKPSKIKNVVKIIFVVNIKIVSYIINILLTVLLIVIITGGIVGGTFAWYVLNEIDPNIESLDAITTELNRTTTIYYYKYDDPVARTNPQEVLLDELHGSENRFWATIDIMPENLINAFIAIEDRRFREHKGVDWYRTINAARNFFAPTQSTFGGSTITQQLVKMMTKDDAQTIQRKIQEMMRAMNLESKSSKSQIMETYLNTIPLSNGCYGVQAAANTIFGKDVSELNLLECASLAAIVKSPTKYDPVRNPDENRRRRQAVLNNMLEYNLITQEQRDEVYFEELVLNKSKDDVYVEKIRSYYVDQVISDVTADLMEKYNYTPEMASNRLFSGGLKIYICVDMEIQQLLETIYNDDRYFPAQREGEKKMQSAMVVIDPYDGRLLGIIGGRGEKVARGWNRATQSYRQPGSSIKPVSVYAPALEKGVINWGKPLPDKAFDRLNGKPWPPNYPAGNEGTVTLSRAIAVSKNTTAVWVLNDLTPEYSFKWLHDDLNIKSLVEEEVTPSGKVFSDIGLGQLALGGMTYGVAVRDLVAAYTMFTNSGVYVKPRTYLKVEDSAGNIILDNRMPEKKIMLSEENAYIMTKLLMGVIENGTASGIGMKGKIQVAGKTGTTNDDKDRWFIGYTPYYLCGAWFGFDTPKVLNVDRGSGNPPMLLFNYVMDSLHISRGLYDNPKEFYVPPSLIEAPYCRTTGMAPTSSCRGYTTVVDEETGEVSNNSYSTIAQGFYAQGFQPIDPCTYHRSSYNSSSSSEESAEKPPETTAEATDVEESTIAAETTDSAETTLNSVPVVYETEPPPTTPEETIGEAHNNPVNTEPGETEPPITEESTNNLWDIITDLFTNNTDDDLINDDSYQNQSEEYTIGAEE